MKRDEVIQDIYRMAGLLEGLSCMTGQTMTEGITYMLCVCVDRLEILGAKLLAEDVERHEEATEARFTKDPYQ
jgi:hypothetical protein